MDANDLKERLFPRLKAQTAAPPPMISTTSTSLLPPIPADDEVEDERRISPFPYSESEDIVLPEDYRPTKFDVINGRGRKSYNHIANRRFRQLISMNLGRYQEARCKVDKTLVVVGIVNTIRRSSPCGGFIKRCPKTNRWISMSDEAAREKVGHCLRDMIASQREEKKRSELLAANNANGQNAKAIEVANSAVNAAVKKKLPGDTGNKRTFKSQSPVDRAKREKSTEGIVGASAWLGETTENEATEERMPSLQRQSSQSQQSQQSQHNSNEQQQQQQMQQHQQLHLHQHDGGVMWQNPFHNNDAAALHAVAAFPAAMVFPPMMHAAAAAAAAHHAAAAAAVAANAGARQPHPPPILGMHVPLSFSNLDAIALQKGNLQDMSEQQRKILMKLEGGWKGSVELLLKESE